MNLKKELEGLVNGEVHTDGATLEEASLDASIFKIVPEVVVSPKNTADIKKLVEFVSSERKKHTSAGCNLSLTPRAAGTDMSGGPLSCSIVLDFIKHFQGVTNCDPTEQTITALPGTYYRDFQDVTEGHGLLLPCYTASWRLNTIGGMVANNSGGEKSLTYGKVENFVTEIKAVLSDGNEYTFGPLTAHQLENKIAQDSFEGRVYKEMYELLESNYDLIKRAKPSVSKNSAGYYLWNVWDRKTGIFDLTKLLVGSQGTLGIITESKLRLVKPKKHSTLLVVFLRDLRPLAKVVNTILRYKPESFESYDQHTTKVALRYLPELIKMMGFGNVFSLGWKFWPELLMTLTGGMPQLVLVAEFTGDSEKEIYAKAWQAEAALEECNLPVRTRVTPSDADEQKYWTIRRQSFDLLRKHVHGKHTAPFIDDICVPPKHLSIFLPRLEEVMGEYDITYTIAGHIGDGNFHIIPLMDYTRPDFKDIIRHLSEEVYDLVLEYNGSIDGEHNDGLIRTPYLETMYGREVVELFERTKEIFDPLNIFNPNKKVGGSLEENLNYVRPD